MYVVMEFKFGRGWRTVLGARPRKGRLPRTNEGCRRVADALQWRRPRRPLAVFEVAEDHQGYELVRCVAMIAAHAESVRRMKRSIRRTLGMSSTNIPVFPSASSALAKAEELEYPPLDIPPIL